MEKLYRMNEAAEQLGVSVKTLQRWDRNGKAQFVRTPHGQRRMKQSELDRLLGRKYSTTRSNRILVIYARVSSHEQKNKDDLQRQIDYISDKMDKDMYQTIMRIEDVGSGLNDKRKGLLKVLALAKEGKITDLAIRYRDRLTRFGFEYLKIYFESYQVTLHVLDDKEETKNVQEELVEDLMAIITSFSGKLYGLRSHKNKLIEKQIKGVIDHVTNLPDKVE